MVNEKNYGSLGLENALYQNRGKIKYDEAGKKVLKHKEVLANILKYSIPEYAAYTCEEIMQFIEGDSITQDEAIAPDSAIISGTMRKADVDTRIIGDDSVQVSTTETNLTFDVKFRIRNPAEKKIHLHIEIELQGNYYPGYPVEKRGIYNLSRMISSQLETVNAKTNYNKLEKAYCIFICVGNVPISQKNTVSYCKFVNSENIGNGKVDAGNIDLMGLVLIRIGEKIDDQVTDIIHFLHGLFYDIEEVEEYIDFSKNEAYRKELEGMALWGDHLILYGQHMEQEKTAEAQRRAEEEKKRAEEAEKRAEEAEKRAEETEVQIKTMLARIAELEKRLKQE